jgi:hypothetical protein
MVNRGPFLHKHVRFFPLLSPTLVAPPLPTATPPHPRPMKEADGHLSAFHANNWQHAMMYGCFALSGLVELLGVWVPLPSGTEQVGVWVGGGGGGPGHPPPRHRVRWGE